MGDYARTASSEPIFQSNADQRLWFFQYTKQDALGRVYSRFEAGGAIRAGKVS
jgi:hypothetical protein